MYMLSYICCMNHIEGERRLPAENRLPPPTIERSRLLSHLYALQ